MASSIVVKVKHGDTLRRFNATVNEDQQIELSIEGLRAKICSLFDFPPNQDLKLTYVDEDMDMVALLDDEDLSDVVKQGLNPLRITVELEIGKPGSFISTATSLPVPQQRRNLNADINAAIADYLKSVPKPLLSKLSTEVISKAADLIENSAKLGQISGSQPSLTGVAASKASSETQNEPHEGKYDLSASVERAMCDAEAAKQEATRTASVLKSKSDCKMTKKGGKDLFRKLRSSGDTINKEGSFSGKGTLDYTGSKAKNNPLDYKNDDKNMKGPYECNFSSIPVPTFVVPQQPPKGLRKNDIFGPTKGAIFHKGLHCDGCGVLPITGPRFKSKVREDYDLCQICFEKMGKDADYIRIDFPAPYRHPWFLKGHPMMKARRWVHPPPPPSGRQLTKQFRPKLDCRFISDVNIMDRTIMAPKAPFTKIWRMRNNGDLPWTRGTQLIWIGGDKFSPTDSVQVEVPVSGFYPESEIDVAVDFIAPESPGEYISFWKMASPSGQKFGHRIWVIIQVDASLGDVEDDPTMMIQKPLFADQQKKLSTWHDLPPFICKPDSYLDYPVIYYTPLDPQQFSAVGPAEPSPSQSEIPENTESNTDLLKEIEQMGFKQVDLNKEVLRKNDYKLKESLDELSDVSHWDLLLEELHGMGFVDKEMNKRVLAKTNGSLKRAVMDLIAGEKA